MVNWESVVIGNSYRIFPLGLRNSWHGTPPRHYSAAPHRMWDNGGWVAFHQFTSSLFWKKKSVTSNQCECGGTSNVMSIKKNIQMKSVIFLESIPLQLAISTTGTALRGSFIKFAIYKWRLRVEHNILALIPYHVIPTGTFLMELFQSNRLTLFANGEENYVWRNLTRTGHIHNFQPNNS